MIDVYLERSSDSGETSRNVQSLSEPHSRSTPALSTRKESWLRGRCRRQEASVLHMFTTSTSHHGFATTSQHLSSSCITIAADSTYHLSLTHSQRGKTYTTISLNASSLVTKFNHTTAGHTAAQSFHHSNLPTLTAKMGSAASSLHLLRLRLRGMKGIHKIEPVEEADIPTPVWAPIEWNPQVSRRHSLPLSPKTRLPEEMPFFAKKKAKALFGRGMGHGEEREAKGKGKERVYPGLPPEETGGRE